MKTNEKTIPRPEHPRPGFLRNSWQNLNGEWEFYMDIPGSGKDKALWKEASFPDKIHVPFCPESRLSGIGNTDFMAAVWYGRDVEISAQALSGRVLLHFGACDYRTTLYVNGAQAGTHIGGYTSFTFDITEFLAEGKNRLVVLAEDDNRSYLQPCGKQSRLYYSHGCDYTRTTGIWQTVWMEFVPEVYLRRVKITATDLQGRVVFEPILNTYAQNLRLRISVSYEGKPVAEEVFPLCGIQNLCEVKVPEVHLWNPGDPQLYDVNFALLSDGKVVDTVDSYFGIRRIDIDGMKVRINGKSVFQRLILDQGFYPEGIYTAPTDADLEKDILLSMQLGFNGARLHQKVFEERFLYHADRLGYLVWGEFADWGADVSNPMVLHDFLPQWIESVERDYNHPAIIGWCPHNETWDHAGRQQINTNISVVYDITKAMDTTRPVIDTSGNFHTARTDIYDTHEYNQKVEFMEEIMQKHAKGEYYENFPKRQHYDGRRPYMLSEYGGIKWSTQFENSLTSWGYGDSPKSTEEFVARFCGMTRAILATPNIMGLCYTQLTDVEQEQNGLYYYDRSPKFSKEEYEAIRATCATKAAIEEE